MALMSQLLGRWQKMPCRSSSSLLSCSTLLWSLSLLLSSSTFCRVLVLCCLALLRQCCCAFSAYGTHCCSCPAASGTCPAMRPCRPPHGAGACGAGTVCGAGGGHCHEGWRVVWAACQAANEPSSGHSVPSSTGSGCSWVWLAASKRWPDHRLIGLLLFEQWTQAGQWWASGQVLIGHAGLQFVRVAV